MFLTEWNTSVNLHRFVNEYADRVQRNIDEKTLERVEWKLNQYGYYKVIHCRDCEHFIEMTKDGLCGCVLFNFTKYDMVFGFCAWGKRKEVSQ